MLLDRFQATTQPWCDLQQLRHARAERRSQILLHSPLAALDAMAPPPPAEPSRYLAPTLTSELDYFPGKPTVKFLCDDSGYACIPHRGYLLRDPLSQAHLALQHFQAALESPHHPDAHHARFLAAGELLRQSLGMATLCGERAMLAVSYEIKQDLPGHRTPWISALTQAGVIRVLCRMFQATGREEYLRDACGAMTPLTVPVARGGVRSSLPGVGGVWYEEYPFAGQCHHVLNGFLTTLFSLHELVRASGGDERARRAYEDGLGSVMGGALDRFDTGYWTRYDLRPAFGLTPSSLRYHCLHVMQARTLAQITGSAPVAQVAERWAGYSRRALHRVLAQAGSAAYRVSQLPRYRRAILANLLPQVRERPAR